MSCAMLIVRGAVHHAYMFRKISWLVQLYDGRLGKSLHCARLWDLNTELPKHTCKGSPDSEHSC